MDHASSSSLAEQLAAAQAWWSDAGVDMAFSDTAEPWAKEKAVNAAETVTKPADTKQAAAAPPTPTPTLGGTPANWPQKLDDFSNWWLNEASLDNGGARPRIAPRGKAGAKLMVLIPEPEAGDSETLLSGPYGKLLLNFLLAADLDEAEIYFASALPRHTPHADWDDLNASGLGAITLHHINLARPERLLVFGRTVLPLLNPDPAQSAASLRQVNHEGGNVPALIARSLELMLARPATRSSFWQRWLDWTED